MKYPYRWSINISINPVHWLLLIVWIGDSNYRWEMRRPLSVEQGHY